MSIWNPECRLSRDVLVSALLPGDVICGRNDKNGEKLDMLVTQVTPTSSDTVLTLDPSDDRVPFNYSMSPHAEVIVEQLRPNEAFLK